MRPLKNTPQVPSPNRFDALRTTTDDKNKESDEQLIQTKLIVTLVSLNFWVNKKYSRNSTYLTKSNESSTR